MGIGILIILNYIVYGSFIIWAIITQDFILLGSIVISTIIVFKIRRHLIIRINNFLIINRSKKTIHQSIDIKTFIMLSKDNNFKDDKVNGNIQSYVKSSRHELKEFFLKCPYDAVSTTTNIFMERQLRSLQNESIIKIEKCKSSTRIQPQILPKIMLMGIKTNIKNIFNKRYWRYITRKEKVSKYKIFIK
jgi:hypothetical protein